MCHNVTRCELVDLLLNGLICKIFNDTNVVLWGSGVKGQTHGGVVMTTLEKH